MDQPTESFDHRQLSQLSQTRGRRPVLTVLIGEMAGAQFPLDPGIYVLGRTPEADIAIPDAGVSRRHAQFHVSPDRVELKDLGSTNGTHVDGKEVTTVSLRDDDKIVVGPNAVLVFHMLEEAELEAQQRQKSQRDEATGLYSRALFLDFLEAEWAFSVRNRLDVSVLTVAGMSADDDESLVTGAAILKLLCRQEDAAARLSDRHCGLLLRQADIHKAELLADRIREAAREMDAEVKVGLASRFASISGSAVELLAKAEEGLQAP